MNDNEIKFGENEKNVYRATSNLNTAIENPQINMNSAVGVNIKDVDSPNYVSNIDSSNVAYGGMPNNNSQFDNNRSFGELNSNINGFPNGQNNLGQTFLVNNVGTEMNSSNLEHKGNTVFAPNDVSSVNGTDYVAPSYNDKVVYEPTIKEKKKNGVTFKITRELKVMLFIIFILLIFILVIPYIYDFFKELQLVITTG